MANCVLFLFLVPTTAEGRRDLRFPRHRKFDKAMFGLARRVAGAEAGPEQSRRLHSAGRHF